MWRAAHANVDYLIVHDQELGKKNVARTRKVLLGADSSLKKQEVRARLGSYEFGKLQLTVSSG